MATLRLAKGTFRVTRGTEGPRHDPYSYTEIEFFPTDENKPSVRLHCGLGCDIEVNGREQDGYDELLAVLQFECYAGIHPFEVERLIERRERNRWKKMTNDEREDWMNGQIARYDCLANYE